MRVTIAARVLILILVSIVLSACATSPGLIEADQWVEPQWFSQVRQEQQELSSWALDCLAEFGVVGEVPIGSGIVGTSTDDAFSPEAALARTAMKECWERLDQRFQQMEQLPIFWDSPLNEAAYNRMLDTRECVIRHGFEVPEPPSLERWIAISGGWGAYGFINPLLTRDEAIELNYECPQASWGSFVWEEPS